MLIVFSAGNARAGLLDVVDVVKGTIYTIDKIDKFQNSKQPHKVKEVGEELWNTTTERRAIRMMKSGSKCTLETAYIFAEKEWLDALDYALKNELGLKEGFKANALQRLFQASKGKPLVFHYLRQHGTILDPILLRNSQIMKMAIDASDIELVKDCLGAGADPKDSGPWIGGDNSMFPFTPKSPLMIVAERTDEVSTDILKLMISAGARPNYFVREDMGSGNPFLSRYKYKTALDFASIQNKPLLERNKTAEIELVSFTNNYIYPILKFGNGLLGYCITLGIILPVILMQGVRKFIKFAIIFMVAVIFFYFPISPFSLLIKFTLSLTIMVISIALSILLHCKRLCVDVNKEP